MVATQNEFIRHQLQALDLYERRIESLLEELAESQLVRNLLTVRVLTSNVKHTKSIRNLNEIKMGPPVKIVIWFLSTTKFI